jgi:hypothetical protein
MLHDDFFSTVREKFHEPGRKSGVLHVIFQRHLLETDYGICTGVGGVSLPPATYSASNLPCLPMIIRLITGAARQ